MNRLAGGPCTNGPPKFGRRFFAVPATVSERSNERFHRYCVAPRMLRTESRVRVEWRSRRPAVDPSTRGARGLPTASAGEGRYGDSKYGSCRSSSVSRRSGKCLPIARGKRCPRFVRDCGAASHDTLASLVRPTAAIPDAAARD